MGLFVVSSDCCCCDYSS